MSTYANPAAESRVQTTARNIGGNVKPERHMQRPTQNIRGSTCPRVPVTTMFGPSREIRVGCVFRDIVTTSRFHILFPCINRTTAVWVGGDTSYAILIAACLCEQHSVGNTPAIPPAVDRNALHGHPRRGTLVKRCKRCKAQIKRAVDPSWKAGRVKGPI